MKLLALVVFLLLRYPFLCSTYSNWIPMYKKDTPYCMKPLLRSEDFHFRNIQVSSMHPEYGDPVRVGWNAAPWCAFPFTVEAFGEWVQVDLGSMKLISGVAVEGGHHASGWVTRDDMEWNICVTHYSVEFSPDGRLWTVVKDENGLPRHFQVEREHKSVRNNYYKAKARYQSFDPFLHARIFRLKIRAWRNLQCLNLELYGCESHWATGNKQLIQRQRHINIAHCHYIQSFEVKYWQLTIYSATYTKNYGQNGLGSEKKWCVAKNRPSDSSWLEFDLIYRRFVSRIEVILHDGPNGKRKQDMSPWKVHYSLDRIWWNKFKFDGYSPSKRILYESYRVNSARYIRVHTGQFPYETTCVQLQAFGCSDEVQSLGLWNDRGRVKFSWLQTYDLRTPQDHHRIRLIDPVQSLSCSLNKVDAKWLSMDMHQVFAINRIIFLGGMDKDGKCLHDKAGKRLEFHYSIDGKIWSLFGTYNQVNGDKPNMGLNVDYEDTYPCYAILDIMPTIYARHLHFYQKILTFDFWKIPAQECTALDIFGNLPGNPHPYHGRRKPGCNAALGMESHRIKDSQLKASTFGTSGVNTRAANARLNSNGGWCVKKILNYERSGKKYHIPNEYLEIDLLSEKFIDGFATQGYSSHNNVRWVTGYVVQYSIDGFSWDVISAEERERYFVANRNNRDTVRHYLNPRICARHVRFIPITWHNMICMRVEIYGCDAGESLQDKLEKKLLEIKKERVQVTYLQPGVVRNKYHEEINLYYRRRTFKCAAPSDDPWWGNYQYLLKLVDLKKSSWVQQAFNNEFNASGFWALFVHELRVLKTRSAKHFICKAIMFDGTELYRHHVIAAKIGMKSLTAWDPGYSVWAEPTWNTALEVPQIIVQQRVDVAYDGGKPVWGKPAVVYASGSVASIGVIVTGIPNFVAAMPRNYIGDRGWSLSYLGPVPNYDNYLWNVGSCERLAQWKGYDHFVVTRDQCYSSHALPANVYKIKDTKAQPDRSQREYNLPYFIKGTRKFQTYEIVWYKLKRNTNNHWIELFRHQITDPDRETSLIFTLASKHDDDQFNYFRARGRYRAYEKVYFGDYFSASHVLEIERVTTADLGTYKVRAKVVATGAWSEAIIELRHEDEPRISLPETFGACAKAPTEVKLKIHDDNVRDPNSWSVNWYHMHPWYGNWKRTHRVQDSTTLRVPYPLLQHTGEWYEADVRNQFGLARGVSRIIVTEDVPVINWVTPSPHLAAKDVSDLLEVKIENEKTLVRVDWYHDGKLIERNTEGFAFPGEKYGSSSFRKTLKLARISLDTAGIYRVVSIGKYCQFEKKVDVRAIISPRLIAEPHAVYMRVFEGEDEVNMNVTVKGGEPKPKLEDMEWTKGSQPLAPSRYGRVVLQTTLNKDENWITVLIIRNLKEPDSGDYTFTVKTGPATTAMTRSLVVIPKHEYFTTKTDGATTDSVILEVSTTSTSRASISYSWTVICLHIHCVILAIVNYH